MLHFLALIFQQEYSFSTNFRQREIQEGRQRHRFHACNQVWPNERQCRLHDRPSIDERGI